MKAIIVAGARPNFIKIAPILRAIDVSPEIESVLLHTGQHYDQNMSNVFFEQLDIRPPDENLDVGSGTHAEQTAEVLRKSEPVFKKHAPDVVIVVGDVNSTLACSLCAVKMNIPVAHVEAGLRSFDRQMPEEINRIVTDAISSLLFVSEQAGVDNLKREGVSDNKIHLVGNVMVDTLFANLEKAKGRRFWESFGLAAGEYGVVTLHRPSNVDVPETLTALMNCLKEIANNIPLVFPVHPRSRARLQDAGLASMLERSATWLPIEPVGYLDFLSLTCSSRIVITDSGGLQEESTALGIPCLTCRTTTERPVTVEKGSSVLVGTDTELLSKEAANVLNGTFKHGECPQLWDGQAAPRIIDIILSQCHA